ncbi:MAG: 7-cyano-7-deazaguanine synthase QueC [Candidatus Altiarchaeota archaeon]
MDSAVAAAVAMRDGFEIYALTFDYGQRHRRELESARKIVRHYKAKEHKILKISLDKIGGSSLTDRRMKIPKKKTKGIPSTYVPARNTILLSYALAFAEVAGADAIYIGANHIDYSGYPDCRLEYYRAFQNLANLATKRAVDGNPVKIRTPLLQMSKEEIIREGVKLKVPFEVTWSCYNGGKKACGRCASCILRLEGFKKAGYEDPIEYGRRV